MFWQNDFVEFNACIATLAQLYETGISGKNDEFLAYRILYLVHAKNRSGAFLVFCVPDS